MNEWHGTVPPRKESRSFIRTWRKEIAKLDARSYLVCATPRSGSTLLCELLCQSGVAGQPEEYFDIRRWIDLDIAARIGAGDDRAFFSAVQRTAATPNAVCGIKIHWHQRMVLHEKILCSPCLKLLGHELDRLNFYDSLNLGFYDLKFIWLRRRNDVAQAISLYRAVQSGHWFARKPWEAAPEVTYNEQAIDKHVHRTRAQDAAWADFFSANGIEPYVVWYEDLAAGPAGEVVKLLPFIGATLSNEASLVPALHKQADDQSTEWEMRYRHSVARERP